nr:hypothetical protein [Micromonospora sp. DSM 115978]
MTTPTDRTSSRFHRPIDSGSNVGEPRNNVDSPRPKQTWLRTVGAPQQELGSSERSARSVRPPYT